MIDKLKKHWQLILLCLFVILFFNKCAVSCTRQTKIDKLTEQVDSQAVYIDSLKNVVFVNENTIVLLNEKINGLENLNSAVSVEREKTDNANKQLNNKNSNQIYNLNLKIRALEKELNEYKNGKKN